MFPLENSQLVENQTVFLADERKRCIFKWMVFFEVFGKLFVFLSCFPPWGSVYVDDNQKNLVVLGFSVLFSSLNCYYLDLYDYKKDEIPTKRRHRHAIRSPLLYFALLNIVLKIIFAEFSFKFLHSPQLFDPIAQKWGILSFHGLRPWFLLLLIAADIIFVTNGLCYCLQQYEPLKDREKYRKMTEKRTGGGDLSILESKSFYILVKNESEKDLNNLDLSISRAVTSKTNDRCGLFQSNSVTFPLKIGKIEAGESITIIPETHMQEGAIKAERFRSFGSEVGDKIVTKLLEKSKDIKAELVEEYERNRYGEGTEEAVNQQPVCPKWSRTAQNPNYMRKLM